ncbi:hypothetical protein [Amycolatopsis sp. WGS_07]|uniref:hypothetical protein n=1 Tax=Amycolatopsis sp. WGS_07 TaxID=3076764 RepID=UPI003872AC11
MSRAKIETKPYLPGGGTAFAVPPLETEPGLAGPLATMPVTGVDPRVRTEVERLLEAARTLRPALREQQASTEARGHYSPEVHEFFRQHGFYRLLLPAVTAGSNSGRADSSW